MLLSAKSMLRKLPAMGMAATALLLDNSLILLLFPPARIIPNALILFTILLYDCTAAWQLAVWIILCSGHAGNAYILSNLYIVRNHRIFSDGHQSEGIDFRFQHVRRFLAYAHDNIGTYFDILCNNRLVDRSSFSDLTVTHDNRIPDHSALFNLYVCPYNRIMYFSVNFSAFTYNAALYRSFGCNVLRADYITLGVDLPEFLIQVEFRNNIDQLHIGFPVRAQGSYIFPVSVEFISKQTLTVVLAVRKNMFSK